MENTLNNLLVKLNELNSLGTVTAIAERFAKLNIKGIAKRYDKCPVVNYLRDYCGISYVRGATAYFVDYDIEAIGLEDAYDNVLMFIQQFDNHMYSNLIQT